MPIVDLIMDTVKYYIRGLNLKEKIETLELLVDNIKDYIVLIQVKK